MELLSTLQATRGGWGVQEEGGVTTSSTTTFKKTQLHPPSSSRTSLLRLLLPPLGTTRGPRTSALGPPVAPGSVWLRPRGQSVGGQREEPLRNQQVLLIPGPAGHSGHNDIRDLRLGPPGPSTGPGDPLSPCGSSLGLNRRLHSSLTLDQEH